MDFENKVSYFCHINPTAVRISPPCQIKYNYNQTIGCFDEKNQGSTLVFKIWFEC